MSGKRSLKKISIYLSDEAIEIAKRYHDSYHGAYKFDLSAVIEELFSKFDLIHTQAQKTKAFLDSIPKEAIEEKLHADAEIHLQN